MSKWEEVIYDEIKHYIENEINYIKRYDSDLIDDLVYLKNITDEDIRDMSDRIVNNDYLNEYLNEMIHQQLYEKR